MPLPSHARAVLLAAALLVCPALSALSAPPAVAITITAPYAAGDLVDGRKHPQPVLSFGANTAAARNRIALRVRVAASGAITQVAVLRSGGSKFLDEYARTWVKHVWRYPPSAREEAHLENITFPVNDEDLRGEAANLKAARAIHPATPRPPYLFVPRLLGWQGVVRLTLVPDGRGNVKTAVLRESSGHALLDLLSQAYAEAYWKLPDNQTTDGSLRYQLVQAENVRPVPRPD